MPWWVWMFGAAGCFGGMEASLMVLFSAWVRNAPIGTAQGLVFGLAAGVVLFGCYGLGCVLMMLGHRTWGLVLLGEDEA